MVLVENRGRLVDKEELLSRVWNGSLVEEANLTQSIFTVRKILGDNPRQHRYIATVVGCGYQFVARTTETSDLPADTAPPRSNAGKRTLIITAAAFLSVAASWLAWNRYQDRANQSGPRQIRSVAVLPLARLAPDGSDDYFADGMTEELITALAKANAFRVISRKSVMRYKNTRQSLPEIARELGVDALIAGTLRRSGNQIRITAQLVGMGPERNLWADEYEGSVGEAFQLQSNVARDIVSAIQKKFNPPPAEEPANRQTDAATYELYLHGRHFLAMRTADGMTRAVEYFQRAIQRDRNYAQAYAGLATTYDLLGMYQVLPPAEAFHWLADLPIRRSV